MNRPRWPLSMRTSASLRTWERAPVPCSRLCVGMWGTVCSFAFAVLTGCQQPGPSVDPFLYRSTIPPPGTACPTPAVTPGPQPYYSPAPAVAAPAAAPTTVQPAPATPVAAPLVPAPLPQRVFPQRGGFDFPQSSNGPPSPSNTAIAKSGGATGGAAPGYATASSSAKRISLASATSPAPATGPSVIRIVEPPPKPASTLPTDSAMKPIATSSTPTSSSTSSAPPGILQVSAAMPLAADAKPAGPATVSPSASVNYPGDHPGLTYGYDPGYKKLRGKLEYSVNTRLWRLRYLPTTGPIDAYGGEVVIADGSVLNGFEAGDYVAVEGKISPPSASSSAATYAINRIKRQ